MWKKDDESFPIYVDIIPGIPTDETIDWPIHCKELFLIAKASRHAKYKRTQNELLLSCSSAEKQFIKGVDKVVKHGYILAKAVRITCIAQPDGNLQETYALDEDIEIDDLISSHMLKSCLIC